MLKIQKIPASARQNVDMVEVKWLDVCDRVRRINPRLADIIDEFGPTKKHTFYKISYPYGTKIRDRGDFFIPNNEGHFIPLKSANTPISVKKTIGNEGTPIWMLLDKSCEIFVETPEKRSIPIKHFYPGAVLGVWEIMGQPKVSIRQDWSWSISAGARTLFMLASIGDAKSHHNLQQAYNLRINTPTTIFDHSRLFSEIINKSDVEWATEILLFNGEWLKPHPKNIGWVKLKEYFSHVAWEQMLYWGNNVNLNLCWEAFLAELAHRNYKAHPYLLDTVKHLVSMGTSTIPGFRPVEDNEIVAPTRLLEEAYSNIYQLKYAPLMMQPDFLIQKNETHNIYYSLQYPTLPEKPVEFKSFPSVMKMMHQLKILMDVFLELMSTFPEVKELDNFDFVNHIRYEFYHNEKDKRGEMQSTDTLINNDPLMQANKQRFKNKKIPSASHFLRGCAGVSFRK